RLHIGTRCGSTSLTLPYSVPTALASPAIELWTTADVGAELNIGFGSPSSPITVHGIGTPIQVLACLPTGLRGVAANLSLGLQARPWPDVTPSDCSATFTRDVRIDNVRLVSDARCTDGAGIFDGGFEAVPTPTSLITWRTYHQLAQSVGTAVAEIR